MHARTRQRGSPLAVFGGLLLLACTAQSPTGAAPVSDQEARKLFDPEPGATADDYRATQTPVRLLGVQGSGEDTFATVLNTETLQVRNVRMGELMGRNLRFTRPLLHGLDIEDSTGETQSLQVGVDLRLRRIEHRMDGLLTGLGKHQYRLRSELVPQVMARYAPGALGSRVTIFPEPALALSEVDPRGGLARLGFQENDLVFQVNGADVSNDTPSQLFARFAGTAPGASLTVDVFRGTASQRLVYTME